VHAVEAVRATRWIALDTDDLVLRVEAERDGDAVTTRVFDDDTCVAEAVVRVGAGPPPATHPQLVGPPPSGPSPWPRDELYSHGMFHGPAFRAVVEIEGLDGREIQARLRGIPPEAVPADGLLTDPVTLDAAGQLVGYWAAAELGRGFTVFPFSIDRVEVFGPELAPGAELSCRARVDGGGPELHADIELTHADGSVHARLSGWRDLRFRLPDRFFDLRLAPRTASLGRELPARSVGLPDDGTVAATLVDDLSDGFLDAHGQIWMRVLAHLILSRAERAEWRELAGDSRRRSEWLRGRAAAKDAVRLLLRRNCGMDVFPADVEIMYDERRAPRVNPRWRDPDDPPTISIAHSGEVAIAVAGDAWHAGVGVDIELTRALPDGFAESALSPDERRFATDGDGRLLALWCAKESAAKALGRGFGGNPQRFVVRAFDAETGVAEIGLAAGANRTDDADEVLLTAYTVSTGELTIATTVRGRSTA
jgi:phosphopantetheinyl transferase